MPAIRYLRPARRSGGAAGATDRQAWGAPTGARARAGGGGGAPSQGGWGGPAGGALGGGGHGLGRAWETCPETRAAPITACHVCRIPHRINISPGRRSDQPNIGITCCRQRPDHAVQRLRRRSSGSRDDNQPLSAACGKMTLYGNALHVSGDGDRMCCMSRRGR